MMLDNYMKKWASALTLYLTHTLSTQQEEKTPMDFMNKHFTEHMEVITLGNRSSVLKILISLKILWEKQIPRTLNLWTSDVRLHREVGRKSLLGEWSLVESMGMMKWMPSVVLLDQIIWERRHCKYYPQ